MRNDTAAPGSGLPTRANLVALWRATLRAPHRVAALAPSSRVCSDALAAHIPATGSPTIVELGAGTGVISDAAARRMPAGARYLALEIDPELVEYLHASRPWLDVEQADAAELGAVAERAGITEVDTVLCTLPWSLLSEQQREHVLGQIAGLLTPRGKLVILMTPSSMLRGSGRGFVRQLRRAFANVRFGLTWRTVSPGIVLVATGPA